MKKKSKLLALIISVLMLSLVTPATIPIVGTVENVSAAIKLSNSKVTMKVGQTKQLKVTGTKKTVKWSSSNKSIASVSTKGKVSAKKKGTVTITAKVSNRKYKCIITVKPKSVAKNFSYSSSGYTYKYLSSFIGENPAGEKCLISYWQYTNKSGRTSTPGFSLVVQAFQNGISLPSYMSSDELYPEVNLTYSSIQSGTSVKIAYMNKLRNTLSPITFEIKPIVVYPNTKIGKYTIKIK